MEPCDLMMDRELEQGPIEDVFSDGVPVRIYVPEFAEVVQSDLTIEIPVKEVV